jgi:hypothetical protein
VVVPTTELAGEDGVIEMEINFSVVTPVDEQAVIPKVKDAINAIARK